LAPRGARATLTFAKFLYYYKKDADIYQTQQDVKFFIKCYLGANQKPGLPYIIESTFKAENIRITPFFTILPPK